MSRVLVVGLDCVPPALAFDRWAAEMPNLTALRRRGRWGPLRSTMPPITVPAWTSMVSGQDPGALGLYGFRNRVVERSRPTYDLRLATSRDVKVKRVWDRLGEAGRSVAALFVPLTSPPTPVRGVMASCFLHANGPWTFPPKFGAELETRFGAYQSDVASFRDGDLNRIFEELHAMTAQHFAIARHVWTERRPDFQMMVEMGPDRMHHAAWRHLDPDAPGHDPGNQWLERALGYYRAVDEELGRLLNDASDATVIVVSDHGARAMQGGFAINELLIQHGWLVLRETPTAATPLRDCVDWAKTRAWGEGGYYARLWLNVKGREPNGTVEANDAPAALETLRALIASEAPSDTKMWAPDELYDVVRGVPPDLFCAFGDLGFRSIGTVGHGQARLDPLALGHDGCNHDWNGIHVAAGPGIEPAADVPASILQVEAWCRSCPLYPSPAPRERQKPRMQPSA